MAALARRCGSDAAEEGHRRPRKKLQRSLRGGLGPERRLRVWSLRGLRTGRRRRCPAAPMPRGHCARKSRLFPQAPRVMEVPS
eukprot:7575224-Pyramimonas_sp.AAC.1